MFRKIITLSLHEQVVTYFQFILKTKNGKWNGTIKLFGNVLHNYYSLVIKIITGSQLVLKGHYHVSITILIKITILFRIFVRIDV